MNMAAHIPATTTYQIIGLDELQQPALRHVAGYWASQRRGQGPPTRQDIKLRDIAGALRHISLIKAIEGDFLYRVVGDNTVRAYTVPLHNRKLSEIAVEAPRYGSFVREILVRAVDKGEAFAVRGHVGRDFPEANFTDFENAFLPLKTEDTTVDHILAASTYTMRPSCF